MSRDEIKRMIAASLSLEVGNAYKNHFGETIVELRLNIDGDPISEVNITVDNGD